MVKWSEPMKIKRRGGAARTAESTTTRATISFPTELYETLEDIARKKKVSLAWVVREATEQYITDRWPLLVTAGAQRRK
jgi:predicted DNA-binding protein